MGDFGKALGGLSEAVREFFETVCKENLKSLHEIEEGVTNEPRNYEQITRRDQRAKG